MARKAKRFSVTKSSESVTVIFKQAPGWGSGKGTAWAKTFKSPSSANRAIKGIESKTDNKAVIKRSAKGFKFGALVTRMNK